MVQQYIKTEILYLNSEEDQKISLIICEKYVFYIVLLEKNKHL